MNIGVLAVSNGNPPNTRQLSSWLSENGYGVVEVESGAAAIMELESRAFAALILEPRLPDLLCPEVVQLAQQMSPGIAAFVIDWATASVSAVAVPEDSLGRHLLRLIESWAEENAKKPRRDRPTGTKTGMLPGMIGSHDSMSALCRTVTLVSRRQTTVLIQGESGTGKELVARAIHELSPRSQAPFVVVNCAAIPEGLLESELFGHVRGAFTGAVQSQLGKIHAANGGTLFLDEIGELPLGIQAKLLRFLQEREVQRVGSTDVFKVDVRVIAATNADLETLCTEGRFREDLFHRLNAFPIALPPLRNRRSDIVALAISFLEQLAAESQEPCKSLDANCMRMIESCGWPGNVRELRNAVERAWILAEDDAVLSPAHFSFLNFDKQSEPAHASVNSVPLSVPHLLPFRETSMSYSSSSSTGT